MTRLTKSDKCHQWGLSINSFLRRFRRGYALVIACFAFCLLHAQEQPASSLVVKKGNTYYYGSQQMNRAAYKRFLQSECPQAWQQYKQGEQCMIAGWTLFGTGIVGTSFMAPVFLVSAFGGSAAPPEVDPIRRARRSLGICLLTSEIMVLASIPLLSVGYVKMDNRSVKTFNSQCAPQKVELAFGLTGSGVGMNIRF